MGKVVPVLMILAGLGTLFWFVVFFFGFTTILKIAVPITLGLMPLNQNLQIWVAVPLPLVITAVLTSARESSSPATNLTIAKGFLSFKIQLSDEDWDQDEFYPVLWLEEGADLDELGRVVQVFSEGSINYAKTYAALFGAAAFGSGFFWGMMWLILKRPT